MRTLFLLLPVAALTLGLAERRGLGDPQALPGLPEETLVGTPPPGELGYDPAYQRFQQELAPYGEWIHRSPYGMVWRPWPDVVGVDFQPYASNGSWVYTDAGWSFASNWSWGWAVFHYGRWASLPGVGWIWVPGNTWGPSWCDWRVGNGMVGWAPLPPVGFDAPAPPLMAWTFVPTPYFVRPDFYRYTLPRYRVREVFVRSSPVTTVRVYQGARFYHGPPPTIVARASGVPIRPVTIAPPRPGIVQPYRVPRPYAGGVAPTYRGGQAQQPPRYGSPVYRNPPQRTYVPGLYRRGEPRPGERRTTYYRPQPQPRPQIQPPPQQRVPMQRGQPQPGGPPYRRRP